MFFSLTESLNFFIFYFLVIMMNGIIFASDALYENSSGGILSFLSSNASSPINDGLNTALSIISQSLQIPVIILLLCFLIFAVYTLGKLLSQYFSRKKVPVNLIKDLIYSIYDADSGDEIREIVKNAEIQNSQKRVLEEIASSAHLGKKSRETLARRLIENEEDKIEKELQKTDFVTRIGPTLGLMGTLIPMGPGLAALGNGDVTALATAITVAFNTTIVGIASGAVSYLASKVRRRWYDQYLANLDAFYFEYINTSP